MSAAPVYVQPAMFADAQPTARSSDPQASRDAAASVTRSQRLSHKERALVELTKAGRRGLTDFELAKRTGVQQTSIGVRRGELTKAGEVVALLDSDGDPVTRPAPSGVGATVWVIAAHGARL